MQIEDDTKTIYVLNKEDISSIAVSEFVNNYDFDINKSRWELEISIVHISKKPNTILKYYDYTFPKKMEIIEGEPTYKPGYKFLWISKEDTRIPTYFYPEHEKERYRLEKIEIKKNLEKLRNQILENILTKLE